MMIPDTVNISISNQIANVKSALCTAVVVALLLALWWALVKILAH